jgi:hypothetical protein
MLSKVVEIGLNCEAAQKNPGSQPDLPIECKPRQDGQYQVGSHGRMKPGYHRRRLIEAGYLT